MQAHFDIAVDTDRDFIRIAMKGFFQPDDVQRFLVALNDAYRRLSCDRHQHLTLCDIREMKIQTQDIVMAFNGVLSQPAYRSRGRAFVVASTLARLQLVRAVGEGDGRYFATAEEAEAWLFDGHHARAA